MGDRFTLGDVAAGTAAGYLSVRFPELLGARTSEPRSARRAPWKRVRRSGTPCPTRRRSLTASSDRESHAPPLPPIAERTLPA
ncbi:hypothetical protein [Methylobacterium sp. NMS14P]|uniref:hypothetical protein n=1 Tax=Methylobacterium sp. NMS14P TaxID=2894310 RepID=UPI003FD00A2E